MPLGKVAWESVNIKHSVNVTSGRCQGPKVATSLGPEWFPLHCLAVMAEFSAGLSLAFVDSHRFHWIPLNTCALFTAESTWGMGSQLNSTVVEIKG